MKTISSAVLLSFASLAKSHDSNNIVLNHHTVNERQGEDWQGDSWNNHGLKGYNGHNGGWTFTSMLGADPTAVPFWEKFKQYPYTRSNGMSAIELGDDGSLRVLMKWELLGDDALSSNNNNIGIHVHAGDASVNGPIVWGCCGEGPLPPFGGPCSQESTEEGAICKCQFCDMDTPECYMGGNSTAAEAALALLGGTTQMYVNLHTDKSFANNDDKPLGLIRGQLMLEDGGSDHGPDHDIGHEDQQYTNLESELRGSVKTSRMTVDNETNE